MYTPGLRDVLEIQPVAFNEWLTLAVLAAGVVAVMEAYKFGKSRMNAGRAVR
jgi:hypothetical protein